MIKIQDRYLWNGDKISYVASLERRDLLQQQLFDN